MKNTTFKMSLFAILFAGTQVAHADEPNELVVGDYVTADWSCTFAKGYNVSTYEFNAYPFNLYNTSVMADKEVWYPPAKYDGKDAVRVINGQPYSSDGVKGEHCSKNTRNHLIKNHRPAANFTVSQENMWPAGTNRVTISAIASDIEEDYGSGQRTGGNIEGYEWRVNGVLQTSTSKTLVMYTQRGGTFNISLKVTDDGVKSYSYPNDTYINGGDNVFKLDYTYTRNVELLPWSCNRACVIW
ncbi:MULTISPECIES: hypothetical protein [unclassified Shewanella]|uniref:hypothetical protein n=1 Tax=unclassified Shewanella TaxID=196818 RepID=UPI003553AF9B